MRASLLSTFALLTTAAQAQDLRLVPEAGGADPSAIVADDCSRGADMALRLSPTPAPVPLTRLPLSGPAPVPIPNLCAEDREPIALFPGARLDRSPALPRPFRFRDAPPSLRDSDPFEFRERQLPYPDLHAPLAPIPLPDLLPDIEVPSDRLQLPPVAPPGDRE